MDFGSSHVWLYEDSDEEYVSDDELRGQIEAPAAPYRSTGGLFSNQPSNSLFGTGPQAANAPLGGTTTLFAARPQSSTLLFGGGPQACSERSVGFGGPSNATYDSAFNPATAVQADSVHDLRCAFGSAAHRANPSDPPSGGLFANRPAQRVHHWQTDAAPIVNRTVAGRRAKASNFHRRADVNVVNVRFNQLIAPSNMHAGEAELCKCGVVMSHISKINDIHGGKVWSCEFCGHLNEVDIFPEEIPTQSDVTFMLEPAPVTTATSLAGSDESLVIFCVDISGSMCQTTPVEGAVTLKGTDKLRQLETFNTTRESQYLPNQRRNVTYVSRLQGVQAAIDNQLSQMAKDHPNRRVALITFSTEVTVVGDGSIDPITIAGDHLLNKDGLIQVGMGVTGLKSVKETKDVLSNNLWNLEEGGQTALGPAMTVAIAMASQHSGSKVIMCTDGAANIGVGSLDNQMYQSNLMEIEDDEPAEYQQFYADLSSLASSKGVSVSVITIKGTDCGMIHLGRVAADTGGQVNIVDPLKLTEEFGNILASPVIATNVQATFIVHRNLYIRGEDAQHTNKIVKDIGNVTAESVQSFEYGVVRAESQQVSHAVSVDGTSVAPRSSQAVSTDAIPTTTLFSSPVAPGAMPMASGLSSGVQEQGAVGGPKSTDVLLPEVQGPPEAQAQPVPDESLKEVPFQLQIRYTDREGAKALRVITQVKPTTRSRDVAEQNVNVKAITVNAKFKSAQLASDGRYGQARKYSMMSTRMMSRAAAKTGNHRVYQSFVEEVAPLENVLSRHQAQERQMYGGTTLSDDEEEHVYDNAALEGAGKKKKSKSKGGKTTLFSRRIQSTTDEVAAMIHQTRSCPVKPANKPSTHEEK